MEQFQIGCLLKMITLQDLLEQQTARAANDYVI